MSRSPMYVVAGVAFVAGLTVSLFNPATIAAPVSPHQPRLLRHTRRTISA